MQPLKAAIQKAETATLGLLEGTADAVGRYYQWARVLHERGSGLPTFEEVIRATLVQALRAHYPQGSLRDSFLEELLLLQVRRVLNATPLDATLLREGPSGLRESPGRQVMDERAEVLLEVTEAVAPRMVALYLAAVRRHLLAPLADVTQGEALLAYMTEALEAWEPTLHALLSPQATTPAHEALDQIDQARLALQGSLTLSALLHPEEGSRLGKVLCNNLPYWLRLASEQDKEQLERLADRLLELERVFAQAGEGLESLLRYVEGRVADHVEHRYGLFVDPSQVRIETAHQIEGTEEVEVSTLAELLVAGPYASDPGVRRSLVQVPENLEAQAVDWPGLLESFDARAGYARALREFYQREDIRALLFDRLDAALMHSVFAARLQGHLSVAGYEVVMRARTSTDNAAQAPSAVGLGLPGIGALALLLFEDREPSAVRPFVLYAPGKYDGQEWIELPSLRALAQEIGGWVKDPQGRLYLLEQLPLAMRERAERYLEAVFLKPVQWMANVDYRSGPAGYPHALYGLAEHHTANQLEAAARTAAPGWYVRQPLAIRQQLNSRNARLNALQCYLRRVGMNPEPFAEFAKRTVSAAIAPYLASRGVTEPVDPDTIVFEFRPSIFLNLPFSGPAAKQTATLMDLAVTGYNDNAGLDHPDMRVRSSIGQDLGQVRAADLARYIRSAYLGDKYAAYINDDYLNAAAGGAGWRGKLFAQLTALTIQRDALAARLKGQLDERAHSQLDYAIERLKQRDEAGPVVLFRAVVRGQPIAQVYVVRLPGVAPQDALLYTPQAPDGVVFRPYRSAFARGLPVAMQLYYLKRARLAAQDGVRERLAAIGFGEASADSAGAGAAVGSLYGEFSVMVANVLADVDRITKSRREVITEQVLKGVGFASIPLGVLFPPIGFVLDAVFIGVEAVRGVQAYRDGDVSAAVGFFVNAYVAGLFLLVPVGIHHARTLNASREMITRYAGIYRSAGARQPIGRGRALRGGADSLDVRQALTYQPSELQEVFEEGLTQGLYRQQASATQPQARYFIKQGKRYFEVAVDRDAGTVRLIDPRHPQAQYKMPVRRTSEGGWSFNREVGLRGGEAPIYVGAVADIAEVFPAELAPKAERIALAGEALSAGYNPAQAGNYLIGVETQGSVVATLYNPSTRRGAVINVDHDISTPIQRSVAEAVRSLGPVDSALPVQGGLIGGDWLQVPGDILTKVNHALGIEGVLTRPAHWLVGGGLGGVMGVLLDLKTGGTLVWRFTSQGLQAFYDPLREYPAFGDANLRSRAQRFWQRIKEGRWRNTGKGRYANNLRQIEAQASHEALALPLHILDS
ncbi:DUF6543 domain-containing protein [Pseudomonas sp. RIT-PI-S]|uniref:dermonecrotic toxin domain-containing protein n=1 Tax=Pseudomonas sp. RIT-PI-S TaxID=3035295 RepID=UPI0021DAA59F|nr:DUF6543 domain-containing protein [Pseudomonas sp. RIT-PI-S]